MIVEAYLPCVDDLHPPQFGGNRRIRKDSRLVYDSKNLCIRGKIRTVGILKNGKSKDSVDHLLVISLHPPPER